MKRSRALWPSLLLAPFLAACGGSIADVGDAGDADGGADAAGEATVPTGPVTTFAVRDVFLGDTDRNGTPSATAWKSFGRDVDGLVTSISSTNVCALSPGAPLANQVDGTNGIDNAWGLVIMPIIQTAASLPTPSTAMSQSIQAGAPTLLLRVTGLTSDPSQTASGLAAQVFTSAPVQTPPAFDSTSSWPVASTSLVDGQTIAGGAKARFSAASVSQGSFDSGPGAGTIVWSIVFQGNGSNVQSVLPIVIHDPEITFDHATAADAVNGTISGVLDTHEFLLALQAMAGSISASLCGSAFDGIAQQIQQAQDILTDGTNQSGVACDAISIGIGFDAKLVADPTTVVPIAPLSNPCQ